MKVAIVQTDLVWENPKANRAKLEQLIASIRTENADLVVLPEMFSTGFTMNSAIFAEVMDGDTIIWMKHMARSEKFALAGSIIIRDQENYYNRLILTDGHQLLATYDKGHLFRMEKENNFFTKGHRQVLTKYMDFSINLQICYDLRFPVWSRLVNNNYHILLYVANWPEARREVWNSLLIARAIENQCYVIGVNRVGKDENGLAYSGDSVIIDPKGRIIAGFEPYTEGVACATLSRKDIDAFRQKFPVWKDADSFDISSK